MVGVLAEHEVGARAGGGDVLDEVGLVDGVPDPGRLVDGLVVRERGVLAEVGRRVAEGGLAQPQEPVDVPALDVGEGGVDVDGEVEEVADREARAAVVDLPTATEPARPITKGVRGGVTRCRNSSCSRWRRELAAT